MNVSRPALTEPRRGEIWFVKIPADPAEKQARPVVVVSMDARNTHPRAETILGVPLSTALRDLPTHIRVQPGESGLGETCDIQAENISTIRKQSLVASRLPLKRLSEGKLRQIARAVVIAMQFTPEGL